VDFETTATISDELFADDVSSFKWTNDIHKRFSHIYVQGLKGLHKVVSDLSVLILVDKLDKECNTCILAKQL
jgi:hypothetical protein